MTSPKKSQSQSSRAHCYLRTQFKDSQRPAKDLQKAYSLLKEDAPKLRHDTNVLYIHVSGQLEWQLLYIHVRRTFQNYGLRIAEPSQSCSCVLSCLCQYSYSIRMVWLQIYNLLSQPSTYSIFPCIIEHKIAVILRTFMYRAFLK